MFKSGSVYVPFTLFLVETIVLFSVCECLCLYQFAITTLMEQYESGDWKEHLFLHQHEKPSV